MIRLNLLIDQTFAFYFITNLETVNATVEAGVKHISLHNCFPALHQFKVDFIKHSPFSFK